MAVDTNITTVSIPKPLADKIKAKIEGTGFNSVSSYVTYVLRQVLSVTEDKEKEKREVFDEDAERQVKENLKKLGYLD